MASTRPWMRIWTWTWIQTWTLILILLTQKTPALSLHSLTYELGLLGAHPTQKYKSFDIPSPETNLLQWDPRCEPGHVLLSPRGHFYPSPGPLIYDSVGDLVWIEERFGMVMDLNVQGFRGRSYLTFWAGEDDGVRGVGGYYMLDSSYEIAYIVTAANNLQGDVHEFKLTPQGTALLTIYDISPSNLSALGGPENGWIYDGLFQEIDVETGDLIFEWRASEHYAVHESFFPLDQGKGEPPTAASAYDFFHINSVDKRDDGTYLVSSRYMHSVTCISPTGEILWILGGKRNMFRDISADLSATGFTWQHDARWHQNNTLSLLDNGANENTRSAAYTRGLIISLDFEGENDTDTWTADTVAIYSSPGHFSSHSQGNLQLLPSGNVFIGWGKPSAYTEFSAQGEVLCDLHWGPGALFWFGWVKSYRAHKGVWVGRPRSPPDVFVDEVGALAYVSWNGATEVVGWVLQVFGDDGEFETVDFVERGGFETVVEISGDGVMRLGAVGVEGEGLGFTRVFEVGVGIGEGEVNEEGIFSEGRMHLLAACVLMGAGAAAWKSRRRVRGLYTYVYTGFYR